MTYLILRFSTLGNLAMMVPVLSSLSRRYPQDKFVVVSKKDLSAVYQAYPNVLFHQARVKGLGLRGVYRLYKELLVYQPDAVVDLHDVLRSKILSMLFRLHHTPVHVIDYGRWEKWKILLRGYRGETVPTEFQRYQQTFQRLGLESDDSFTSIPVDPLAQTAIQHRLGVHNVYRIGFAPFAKRASNMLSYRKSKEIIQQLSQRPDTHIYLFGAGEVECEVLRQWAGLYDNVESVAGQLTLAEELELMRELDVMLCMDSANQHLASLVGLRAVSVWTATHPKMGFFGWKQREEDCIQRELRCRPCTMHGARYCHFFNFACKNINTQDICQKLFH